MKLNTLKKTVAAAVVSVGLAQPAAAWDVVFDPTAVMQAVQQLAQLKAQYEQLKQQYQAVTGNGGYANGQKVEGVVPGSWQDVVNQQKNKKFAETYTKSTQLMAVTKGNILDELKKNQNYKNDFESAALGMSFAEESYNQLNKHLKNLNILKNKINQTRSIKEAQDLANAIAIESATIQSINAQLGSVQTNLAAVNPKNSVTSSQSFNAWLGR